MYHFPNLARTKLSLLHHDILLMLMLMLMSMLMDDSVAMRDVMFARVGWNEHTLRHCIFNGMN